MLISMLQNFTFIYYHSLPYVVIVIDYIFLYIFSINVDLQLFFMQSSFKSDRKKGVKSKNTFIPSSIFNYVIVFTSALYFFMFI